MEQVLERIERQLEHIVTEQLRMRDEQVKMRDDIAWIKGKLEVGLIHAQRSLHGLALSLELLHYF